MRTRRRGLIAPTVAMLVAVGILGGLGTWQVRRLAWKEALIARVHERLAETPVDLPDATVIAGQPDEAFEYRPVRVAGTVASPREFHVFTVLGEPKGRLGGPGWFVIAPFRLADGRTLFVNRGFVPDATRRAGEAIPPLSGSIVFTGVLRGRDSANLFTPTSNPAADSWYVRDPAAFARELGLAEDKVYPVTVDMAANATPASGLPQAGETQVTFPNSHLGYAITWYGLMLAAIGVWAAFIRARLRRS